MSCYLNVFCYSTNFSKLVPVSSVHIPFRQTYSWILSHHTLTSKNNIFASKVMKIIGRNSHEDERCDEQDKEVIQS